MAVRVQCTRESASGEEPPAVDTLLDDTPSRRDDLLDDRHAGSMCAIEAAEVEWVAPHEIDTILDHADGQISMQHRLAGLERSLASASFVPFIDECSCARRGSRAVGARRPSNPPFNWASAMRSRQSGSAAGQSKARGAMNTTWQSVCRAFSAILRREPTQELRPRPYGSRSAFPQRDSLQSRESRD